MSFAEKQLLLCQPMPVAEVELKEYVIGLLPMVLQLAILAALVRRDLLKDLRWFFSYTAFQSFSDRS